MCVVPMFFEAAATLASAVGISAPSGIWNGRVRVLTPTSSGPERWMSIGYQPTPTESGKWAARGPRWYSADTSCSTTVRRARMRRASRM